jgi:hypothetical protein
MQESILATEAKNETAQTPGEIALWVGVLAGPLVWFAQMESKYALVSSACTTASQITLHVVSIVSLLVTAAAAILSWRSLNRAGSRKESDRSVKHSKRVRFMAESGLVLSCIFFLVILAQEIPNLVISPCLPG